MRPNCGWGRQPRAPLRSSVHRDLSGHLTPTTSTTESRLWKTTTSSSASNDRPPRYGADQPHTPNSHRGWTEERGPVNSTGVYWKPVWAVLEDSFALTLVNAQHVKNVPGRKTDTSDAAWLCRLF